MSNHVILVKSCPSCQIMSFLSNHVIHCVIETFQVKFSEVGEGREGVKYVFLGL
jgi:hypothetical protein